MGKLLNKSFVQQDLLDPEVEVRPIEGQIDDLVDEIKERIEKHERTSDYDANGSYGGRFNLLFKKYGFKGSLATP